MSKYTDGCWSGGGAEQLAAAQGSRESVDPVQLETLA